MTRYLIRRLWLSVLVLFGVSVVVFMLLHLAPGDPVRLLLADDVPDEIAEQVRRDLGFDQPLHVQYWVFITKALRGDLGQ
jgi:peptide/nickel transport system permease protein